jgi:ATP/maltotriose-dependent transcriptional regulator MalT
LPTALNLLPVAITESESRTDNTGLRYLLCIAHAESLARASRVEAALEAHAKMQSYRHPSYVYAESKFLLASAWVAAARGRVTEACGLATQAADFAHDHHQYAREVIALQTAIQFGHNDAYERLAELAEIVEGPRAQAVASWSRGLVDNDGDALLKVSHDLESMGDLIAAADAAAHAALAFDTKNLRGSRLTASARASRLITDCGANTPATQLATCPLPLTSREHEIATLVGDGLSNKQIADALFVSVRSVEGHIYRACNKLGITSRTELGTLVTESTLGST